MITPMFSRRYLNHSSAVLGEVVAERRQRDLGELVARARRPTRARSAALLERGSR
jgi:hypothetical protein